MPDALPTTAPAGTRPDATTHLALHADALALLTGWEPTGPAAALARDRTLELLGAGPVATRAGDTGPGTSPPAPWSLDERRRVLLCLHGRMGRWMQLGGHCEAADPTLAGGRAAGGHRGVRHRRAAARPRTRSTSTSTRCAAPRPTAAGRAVAPLRRAVRRGLPQPARSSGSATSPRRWAGSPRTRCPTPLADGTVQLVAPALAALAAGQRRALDVARLYWRQT